MKALNRVDVVQLSLCIRLDYLCRLRSKLLFLDVCSAANDSFILPDAGHCLRIAVGLTLEREFFGLVGEIGFNRKLDAPSQSNGPILEKE